MNESASQALTAGKAALESMSFGDAFALAAAGVLIVFFVLIVLMAVIKILRGFIESMEKSQAAAAAPALAAAAPAAADPNAGKVPAKGSLGEIKLHNVDDKTAAMLMAIVADDLQAPLNELRFLSIREKQ